MPLAWVQPISTHPSDIPDCILYFLQVSLNSHLVCMLYRAIPISPSDGHKMDTPKRGSQFIYHFLYKSCFDWAELEGNDRNHCRRQAEAASWRIGRNLHSQKYSAHWALNLRPPAHNFEAILLYDRNQLKRHVALCFRLPFLSIWMCSNQWQAGLMWYLPQKNLNQFQTYDNIAEKGCAGGLNSSSGSVLIKRLTEPQLLTCFRTVNRKSPEEATLRHWPQVISSPVNGKLLGSAHPIEHRQKADWDDYIHWGELFHLRVLMCMMWLVNT